MPAWNALYQIKDFAYRIRDVTALCRALMLFPRPCGSWISKLGGFRSQSACQPGDHNTFEIHYSIEWDEPGPFNSQLNEHHAFINLAEILMYVPDQRAEDASVDIRQSARAAGEQRPNSRPAPRRMRMWQRATTSWWMHRWKRGNSTNSDSMTMARIFA